MAALTPAVPDKAAILPLVEMALAWDLNGSDLPSVDVALDMAEEFSRYGRMAVDELRTQCLSIPADSDACLGAQATLAEAAWRLRLKPLARSAALRSATRRAQNLACLVQALNRATEQACEERACRAPEPAALHHERPPMKTSNAVLVASAVGAVGLWLAERRHRQRLALDTAHMHQQLLADIAADPGHRAIWATNGLSDEENVSLMHCNRLISFLSVKFRVGLLDRAALRVQARALMERAPYRAYWSRSGSFREEEAMDRTDHTFNAILAEEYTAAADDPEPVSA
ncbi:DUF6082 family protein [Streptomyces griseoincarnatus]